MDEYPVKVGSMLFTLVDPNKGHEVSYNRWYERDHFYAGCMIGPWLFAGSRWVSPRTLKDMRWSDGSGAVAEPVDAGSYLAIYWVHADHHEEHFKWAGEQVVWLYANERGFPERQHAHTILADRPWAVYRDDDGVPLELALDHRFSSLYVVALDSTGDDDAQLNEFLRTEALPKAMADSPIAITSSWKPEPRDANSGSAPMDLGTDPGTTARTLQLLFSDAAPEAAWDRVLGYVGAVNASGLANARFAAPFVPTVVGTDTYSDQLW
jgi:hypothetical protein